MAPTPFDGGYMGPGRKDKPDSFGVCDTQKQVDIRNEALVYLGSPAYDPSAGVPAEYSFSAFPPNPGGTTCNILSHIAVAQSVQSFLQSMAIK